MPQPKLGASRRVLFAVALVVAAAAAGCARKEAEAPSLEPGTAERAQALIESGNQAYSAGDYQLAARRYGAAAVVKDDDPAAYYGLGMALTKLGRDEEARIAYARSRRLIQQQADSAAAAHTETEPQGP